MAPFFQVDEEKSLRNEIKFKFSSWAPFFHCCRNVSWFDETDFLPSLVKGS